MNTELSTQVKVVLNKLNLSGHRAYIVGGAIRNIIMGLPVHDWDIATDASPETVSEVFSGFRVVETGIKHGTVTVIIDRAPIEITTFRAEKGYSDHRRPDEVLFVNDLTRDLSRRDFTCNAIAYNPDEGITDPFNGLSDINNKIIRCVGNSTERFEEDALRILRALRFSSVLNFDICTETSKAIHKYYSLLKFISVERIYAELRKLVCGDRAAKVLDEYSDVFFFLMPELKAMKGCEQNHIRHIYDVWGHTLKAVDAVRPVPELRLAMLFHDCGKPCVKSTDEKGIDHFYSHSEKSKELASDILYRFKASNSERNHICTLVEKHGFEPDIISRKTYRKYIGSYGPEIVKELFEVREADFRAQNPVFIESEIKRNEAGLETLNLILGEEPCFSLKDLKINGNDLLSLGISPTHLLGSVLNRLLEEVMDGRIKNNKADLLKRAEDIYYGNSKTE